MKRKEVLEKLWAAGIHEDRLTAHADGSFTFKRSYYYMMGNSAEKIAEKIKTAIPEVKILEAYDAWKAWPKTSYFVVKFNTIKEEN